MARPRKVAEVTTAAEIYEDDHGIWHGWVEFPRKPDGSRDRRHRKGKDEIKVRKAVYDLEKLRDERKRPATGKPVTVRAWIETWLTDIAPHGEHALRPRTLEDYWGKARHWIFPNLGGIALDDLSTDDLDRLYAKMRREGKAAGTVLKVHAIIRRALGVAIPRGKITSRINVAAIIDNPGVPARPKADLDTREAHLILDAIAGRRNPLLWRLRLALGPRQGTLLAIEWTSVDLDAGTVDLAWQHQRRKWRHGCADPHSCGAHRHKVKCPGPGDKRHQKDQHAKLTRGCPKPCARDCQEHAVACPDRNGGGLVRCRPKHFRADDTQHLVAIPASLIEEFRVHKRTQWIEKTVAGDLWEEHGLVFCQENGRPISPEQDYRELQAISELAGIGRRGTHWFRAFAATYLVEEGENVEVAQDLLGHADPSLTKRVYVKAGKKLTQRAADRMDAGLFGGRGASRGAGLATPLATPTSEAPPEERAA